MIFGLKCVQLNVNMYVCVFYGVKKQFYVCFVQFGELMFQWMLFGCRLIQYIVDRWLIGQVWCVCLMSFGFDVVLDVKYSSIGLFVCVMVFGLNVVFVVQLLFIVSQFVCGVLVMIFCVRLRLGCLNFVVLFLLMIVYFVLLICMWLCMLLGDSCVVVGSMIVLSFIVVSIVFYSLIWFGSISRMWLLCMMLIVCSQFVICDECLDICVNEYGLFVLVVVLMIYSVGWLLLCVIGLKQLSVQLNVLSIGYLKLWYVVLQLV